MSCDWVSKHPPRCKARGTIPGIVIGSVEASYACPAACGTTCNDSPTWHKKGNPLKKRAAASGRARDARGTRSGPVTPGRRDRSGPISRVAATGPVSRSAQVRVGLGASA